MRTSSICFTILLAVANAIAGVAEGAAPRRQSSQNDLALLLDRVWIEAPSQQQPAGLMMTFLPDGTLIVSSCEKTYELTGWSRVTSKTIGWQQDGRHVSANVISISIVELVLDIAVEASTSQHVFRAVEAPFKC